MNTTAKWLTRFFPLLIYSTVVQASDMSIPVIVCPDDIAISDGDSLSPGHTGTPMVSDDSGMFCLSFVDTILAGGCPDEWTILREWVATDAAGNVARCDQVISVLDTTPPFLVGVPADVEVECGDVPAPPAVRGTDGYRMPQDGLALYYSFDVDEGALVTDFSPSGYHGEVMGATYEPEGRHGGAMRFDGNDLIRVGHVLDIGGDHSALTVSIWFKAPPNPGAGYTLIGKNQDLHHPYTGWSLRHDPRPQADLIATYPQRADAVLVTNLFDDSWHHMVGVFEVKPDSLSSVLFIDGAAVATSVWAGAHSGTETFAGLILGNRDPHGTEPFIGLLDEARIYTRKLSDAEIVTLYEEVADSDVDVVFHEEIRPGCSGQVIRTWTATDACGNSTSVTQVITVVDTTPPDLIGVPDDIEVDCGSVPPPAMVTALDACDSFPGDGLVLYYPFDEDLGDIVLDASGGGRTGTVNGAVWVADGARGGAYRFDNISQNITADDAGLPSGNDARTVALWLKLDVLYPEESTEYFSYGTRGYNQLASLGIDWRHDRDPFNFSQFGGVFLSQQQLDQDSEWYHVVYTYDGSHKFYINGSPSSGMNELRGPLNTTLSGLLMLGGHPQNGGSLGPDGGYLDEVMVFNRALTPEEVVGLYTRRIPVEYSEIVEGDCPAVLTRTWTATDICGNAIRASQVITIQSRPVAISLNGIPEDMTVGCGDVPEPPRVTATSECMPEGLILYYPFDRDDWPVALDYSGGNRNALVGGATWIPNGARGGAYRFDGNENITADDLGLPHGNQPRSLALWYKTDEIYADESTEFFSYGTRAINRLCSLGIDWRDDRNQFSFSQYGGVFLASHRVEQASRWYHVVYAYDGATHRFYINGEERSGMNELFLPLNTELSGLLTLGGHPQNAGSMNPDSGYLDEVMVFNRALTPEEVVDLYTRRIPVEYSEIVEGDCPAVITRTWTATDACGNTVGATQVITVVDTGELDSDGDGVNDRDEETAGTNPHDPDDYFFYTMTSESNKIVVAFASRSNRVYTLQFSEQLSGGAWSNVVGQIRVPGSGGTDSLWDTMNNPTRVYRVIVDLP